jgi:FG-GAP repeat protein
MRRSTFRICLLAPLALTLSGGWARAQTSPPADATITGEGADDDFGWRVAPAGDVDADGFPDLIVGAPSNDFVDGFAGRAYLFYGPITGDLDAADADAIVSAEAFGDNLGIAVSSAGDVNADGFDDVLIGARGNDTPGTQAGRAYLFLGPIHGELDAIKADAIISGAPFEEIGGAVAPAGDLDEDGFDDILLGTAAFTENVTEGQAFVFYGPLSGHRTSASAEAIIRGTFFSESLGAAVASAGDVNQDGINDIIIGAPHFPLKSQGPGRAYVFYGPVLGALSAASADAILFGEGINDAFGTSVAPAGDVNGDGIADVVVGAEQIFTNNGTGKAYMFLGPLSGPIQASAADAILLGEAAKDLFGISVAGGDVNGDGFSDVVVGAWNAVNRSGRAYVFHGPLAGTIPAAAADRIVTGGALDQLGLSVAVGDVNGDEASDVLLGAPQFTDGAPGYAAIFFGAAGGGGDLSLALTPHDPPIEIPPGGGSFHYDVDLINQSDTAQTVDVWIVASGPGGSRTLARTTRTLPPGAHAHRTFTQTIPGTLAPGTYTVTGNAGTFPVPEVSDSFAFVK